MDLDFVMDKVPGEYIYNAPDFPSGLCGLARENSFASLQCLPVNDLRFTYLTSQGLTDYYTTVDYRDGQMFTGGAQQITQITGTYRCQPFFYQALGAGLFSLTNAVESVECVVGSLNITIVPEP